MSSEDTHSLHHCYQISALRLHPLQWCSKFFVYVLFLLHSGFGFSLRGALQFISTCFMSHANVALSLTSAVEIQENKESHTKKQHIAQHGVQKGHAFSDTEQQDT